MKVGNVGLLVYLISSLSHAAGTSTSSIEVSSKSTGSPTGSPDTRDIIQTETYEEDDDTEPAEAQALPPPLTGDDFDDSTHEILSFVEFYSPYCSHCTQFFPTWKQTYEEFYPELKKLNIQMRQVNCIESGDLCERENVDAYPSLRIYTPTKPTRKEAEKVKEVGEDGEKPAGSKHVESFPRTVLRTPENLKKFMKNAVAEYNSGAIDLPSSSSLMNVDEILTLVAGNITDAYFVAFYPASEEQFKQTEITNKNMFDRSCADCFDIKQTWDKLSNQILTKVKTGHFSCYDNPTVCKQMGFTSLAEVSVRGSSRMRPPKFVMFLPKSVGLIRIDYEGLPLLEPLKAFADRLYENAQYELVTSRGLTDVMEFRESLPFHPLESYYPLENKVAVVFYYDINTVTEEDRAILPYLLEYVTRSPFNMYLYTAKHTKIQNDIAAQAENLIEYINYDKENGYTFDKKLFLATSITNKPTIYIFKDNALFTQTYQTFAIEDMRDFKKIEQFITKNQYPLYQEVTPELLPYYFSKDPEQLSYKVVVTFLDPTDAKFTDEAFYNMSLAAHEYYYLKKQYYFNVILKQRQDKVHNVEKLEEQGGNNGQKIITEMRREVPHFFDQDEVVFTFIDINRKKEFEHVRGWKFDSSKFNVGDTIIISKDNRYYWDKDINGNILKIDPYVIKPVLLGLLDNEMVKNSERLVKKLVGSPYGPGLRFMDKVHDYGLKGYVALIVVLWFVFVAAKRWRRRARKGVSTGILGSDKND